MPPPRKEPKETVVYPSSKRKVPAFKPLRPNKIPRISTTESESSVKSKATTKPTPKRKNATKRVTIEDSEDEDDDDLLKATAAEGDDSDGLAMNPLAAKPRPMKKATTAKRKTPIRKNSHLSVSSENGDSPPTETAAAQFLPTQSDGIPSIPQALLLRLMHEAFADKNTKIDTHAIVVIQKYVEVFVREAIARAKLDKEEAVEKGGVSQSDVGWLEVEDLEKAAPALFLDF